MSKVAEARPVKTVQTDTFQPVIGTATEGLGAHLVGTGALGTTADFRRVRDEALEVVRRCRPFEGADGRRTGLVVGYVQSGKTMSMTTVASLARDNGCRIVVLLAGVTTNLLRQNATRFRDTLRAAAEGKEHWLIINSEDGKTRDSDAQTLRQAVEEWRDPAIAEEDERTLFFAVLKNHAHLDWLGELLGKSSLSGVPALILDDEADQAGLNVRPGDDDPSTTYLRIDRVRDALPHHTYLQYTATPQAPLLISIDDMLSPEFAELVEPGQGYTGGATFFSKNAVKGLVRIVPEADRFKAGEPPSEPPASLLEALSVFLMGCAVARTRGKPRPRSMLVHPSQRNSDQSVFLVWINEILKRWSTTLADLTDADRPDTLEELKAGYDDLAKTDTELPPFESLLQPLLLSIRRIAAKKVNSEDGSEVDWKNAEEHILVGGEKLNRGYTVEGLTVTYMPRDAGGWSADTLQQRARFFGYKASYLSLCRIYLHPDVDKAYRDYVVHEKNIRSQLAEHRGRPLREWRRAFFLDAKMRPTRSNVLSDPLYRVKKDKGWFVQRYPHAEAGAVAFNAKLVEDFCASLTFETRDGFDEHLVAEASLDAVLKGLLLEFKAPRETAAWYGQLVSLSDRKVDRPDERVIVVKMMNSKNRERTRSQDKKTGALTLHQGRSSADDGEGGDKEVIMPGMITLQLHRVRVKPNGPVCDAIALYNPERGFDAIAQDQGS